VGTYRLRQKFLQKKKIVIERREEWLANHSQSSWYRYQVRLCGCDQCPTQRQFGGILEELLPQLANHKNFIPTPQKDDDTDHYLQLFEVLDRPYHRPDFFMPENPGAKIKPVLCELCGDVVCTSQKDYRKHRLLKHGGTTTTASTAKNTTTVNEDAENTSTTAKTPPRKASLKRTRSKKKISARFFPEKKSLLYHSWCQK